MAYVEVLIGGAAAFLLGFAWYTALFGKAWQAETGITEEQAQTNMPLIHGLAFLMMCFLSMGVNYFFSYHEDMTDHNFMHGAFHGGLLALQFGLPVMAIHHLYQRKSLKLFLIDGGYVLAFMALSGGVMAALQLG